MSQFSMTSQQQQPIPTGFEQLVYIVSSSKAADAGRSIIFIRIRIWGF